MPPRSPLPKRRANGHQDEDPVVPQSFSEDLGASSPEKLAPTVPKSKKRAQDTRDADTIAEDVPGKKVWILIDPKPSS